MLDSRTEYEGLFGKQYRTQRGLQASVAKLQSFRFLCFERGAALLPEATPIHGRIVQGSRCRRATGQAKCSRSSS